MRAVHKVIMKSITVVSTRDRVAISMDRMVKWMTKSNSAMSLEQRLMILPCVCCSKKSMLRCSKLFKNLENKVREAWIPPRAVTKAQIMAIKPEWESKFKHWIEYFKHWIDPKVVLLFDQWTTAIKKKQKKKDIWTRLNWLKWWCCLKNILGTRNGLLTVVMLLFFRKYSYGKREI